VRAGLAVVAAAGNFGKLADGRAVRGGIVSPGNSPWAITVGALDTHGTPERSDDTVASYSSRGPTRYDLVLKPDLVAPGSGIVSAEAAGAYLATNHPERHVAGAGTDAYMRLSGTSMAAAVVSGAVAIAFDQRRNLTPVETKAVLQLTSSQIPGEGLAATGAGSLNVLDASAFLTSTKASPISKIAGERIRRSGLIFQEFEEQNRSIRPLQSVLKGKPSGIVWRTEASDTIIWSTNDTIIWSTTSD